MLKTITSAANTVGSLEYKGLWNAATNTPTLVSSVGTQGDYYVVSVAGTTNLDGVTTWDEGDWAIFNGSVWQLFQDGQDGVFATLTVSNYAAFADNAKATFGTGAGDLQIYHDGSSSRIANSTGNLIISDTDGDIFIQAKAGENSLKANNDGSVELYFDGVQKFNTTATGIDISGTATMDGLVVEGNTYIDTNNGANAFYVTRYGSVQNESASFVVGDGSLTINSIQDEQYGTFRINSTHDGVGTAARFNIDNDGDISFYEDTGTSPKFVWSSSAESLGVGNSSPSSSYSIDAAKGIRSSGASPNFTLQETDASNQTWLMASYGGKFAIRDTTVAGTAYPFQIEAATPSNTLYLDSTGNVGIGTSLPAQAKLDILLESDYSSHTGHGLSILSNAADAYTSLYIGTDDTIDSAYIQSAGKNTSFTSKKLLLNPNGGNVGIGTAPASVLDVSGVAPTLTLRDSRTGGSWTAGTALGKLDFYTSDSSGIGAHSIASIGVVAGGVNAASPDGELVFATGGYNAVSQERSRLTSDGNFLVGTTDAAPATNNVVGISLRNEGHINVSRASGVVGYFNRKTSDGTVLDIRKDGTSVGSIGTNSAVMYLGSDDVGLRFDATSNALSPWNTTTAALNDAGIDLGRTTGRFKNLYLSQGVVFGTTGGSVSSKTLDDYEEGTWTPVLADAATAGNTATMTADGRYTKIGRLITVECRMLDIDTTGMTAGNNIFIRGLPEVVSVNSRAIGSVSLDRVNFTNYVVVIGGANTSYALLSDQIDSDQDVVLTVAAITSTGSDITFTLQYTI
jgi:hypothetical protein